MGRAIFAKSRRSFACGPCTLASAFSGSAYSPPAACLLVVVGQPASHTVLRLLSVLPASLLPFLAGVPAIAVGQPAKLATCGKLTVALLPSGRLPVALASFAICDPLALPTVGLGQPDRRAVSLSDMPFVPLRQPPSSVVPLWSRVVGVGHEVNSLADMRAAEARSAEIARPEGVTRSFQVSRYKIEPVERACNLFANEDWRAALADEIEPCGPEMSVIVESFLLSGRTERLARARACPYRFVVRPSGGTQGARPYADAREEVALRKLAQLECFHVPDAALVGHARCDMSGVDQVAQPLRRERVVLVVVSRHRS